MLIQSFADYDDITPDMAHEIGVKLAEELWGDRFQVIVATHLNTKCLHNHFVINSVSFADGKSIMTAEYLPAYEEVSDSICRQYGLTVIEKPTGAENLCTCHRRKKPEYLQDIAWQGKLLMKR